MTNMTNVNVYLSENEMSVLKTKSNETGESVSHVIRTIVCEKYGFDIPKSKKMKREFKKPEDCRRIGFLVTPEEEKMITNAAKQDDVGVSAYVRQTLLNVDFEKLSAKSLDIYRSNPAGKRFICIISDCDPSIVVDLDKFKVANGFKSRSDVIRRILISDILRGGDMNDHKKAGATVQR